MQAPETQPLCEACWITDNGESLQDPDTGATLIVHVPVPTRSMLMGLEQCCQCGNPTISGIYVKRDPSKVPYPSMDDGDVEPAVKVA